MNRSFVSHLVDSVRIIFRSFSFLGRERKKYLLGWFFSSAEICSAFITPFLYKQLIEIVTNSNNTKVINIVIVSFIALIILSPIVCIGVYLRMTATDIGIGNIQKAVFNHVQYLPISRSLENRKGDYITRLSNDAQLSVGMFKGYAITGFFKFIIYFVVSCVILININIQLALVSISFSVVSYIIATFLNPKVRSLELVARRTTSETASYLIEAFRCAPIIRIFLLKDYFLERYQVACKLIVDKRIAYRTLNQGVLSLVNLFSYSVQPIGFIIGILYMVNNRMEISQIVFATSIMSIMAAGMRDFSKFVQFIQPGIVASKRVFELLDEQQEEIGMTQKKPDLTADNAIVLKNINFSYPSGKVVLHKINLTVRNGEVLAIVGGSGGGKSTLLKLLQAFYMKNSGDILFFDSHIEDLSLIDIRKLSTYVQQECILFDGTILENISLGIQKYSFDEVVESAKKANIHDFIMSLPSGYDTLVGERGALVSGGQKQRITIARAILKNAPILLLDEATSALDSQTENEVHQALEMLMKDKTTIIIAHRLNTVQNSDRIIVMEDGKIIEEGIHSELIQINGRYRVLVESQFK